MINWLVDQTLLISVFTLFYILIKPAARRYIGASGLYAMWVAIPAALLFSMLSFPKAEVLPVYRYVVEAKQVASSITEQWIDFHSVILLVWALVFFTLLLTVLLQHRRYLSSLDLTPSELAFDDGKGIDRLSSVQVLSSEKISSPFVLGLVHPKLVLPAGFNGKFDSVQKRLILQHENIHVQRCDLIWNGMGTLILLAFWFNPLSWQAFKLFRQSQEMACDQAVVRDLNKVQRQSYAAAMLDCAVAGTRMNLTLLNYGAKELMKERLVSLKTHQKHKRWSNVALVAITLSALLSISVVGAKKHEQVGPAGEYPVTRIEPLYPVEAAAQGIEGSVILSFDINTDGSVSNAKIVESNPEQVFDRTSKVAVEQWTYKPMKEKQTGILVQLDYKMDESSSKKTMLEMSKSRETIAVVK